MEFQIEMSGNRQGAGRMKDKGKERVKEPEVITPNRSEDECCIHGIPLSELCEKCVDLHTITQNRDEW